mmetsp:Transcript_6272/g.15531  ORF Transcript_6272/g.15531 Transcript_6272/m.15531 type:complete len:82 (-) Transcript_6272:290-535(-)
MRIYRSYHFDDSHFVRFTSEALQLSAELVLLLPKPTTTFAVTLKLRIRCFPFIVLLFSAVFICLEKVAAGSTILVVSFNAG